MEAHTDHTDREVTAATHARRTLSVVSVHQQHARARQRRRDQECHTVVATVTVINNKMQRPRQETRHTVVATETVEMDQECHTVVVTVLGKPASENQPRLGCHSVEAPRINQSGRTVGKHASENQTRLGCHSRTVRQTRLRHPDEARMPRSRGADKTRTGMPQGRGAPIINQQPGRTVRQSRLRKPDEDRNAV